MFVTGRQNAGQASGGSLLWFRPSDAKGARAIDKLPMSNLKQLYRAIESRLFIDS